MHWRFTPRTRHLIRDRLKVVVLQSTGGVAVADMMGWKKRAAAYGDKEK